LDEVIEGFAVCYLRHVEKRIRLPIISSFKTILIENMLLTLITNADSNSSAGTEVGICKWLMLQCPAQLALPVPPRRENPMLPAAILV
jgi:hypothetical protein